MLILVGCLVAGILYKRRYSLGRLFRFLLFYGIFAKIKKHHERDRSPYTAIKKRVGRA